MEQAVDKGNEAPLAVHAATPAGGEFVAAGRIPDKGDKRPPSDKKPASETMIERPPSDKKPAALQGVAEEAPVEKPAKPSSTSTKKPKTTTKPKK